MTLALALLAALPYVQTAGFGFVHLDDGAYVFENPRVQEGLSWSTVRWAFTTGENATWHPLTWLAHALDFELFGLWAGGHHLSNVAMHALSSALLFLVLRSLTGGSAAKETRSTACSFFVALLFAVHPAHVESVAWISERKDTLSAFFWMLTLAAYAGYVHRGGLWRYGLVLLAFACGLMAKPMVVTLPCVLLLLDYWPLGRIGQEWPPRRLAVLAAEKAPLLALSLGASVVTVITQKQAGAVSGVDGLPMGWRIENAVESYFQYLSKTLFPHDLVAHYPHPLGTTPWPVLAGMGAALFAITAAALLFVRKAPWLVVGWLWFLGVLFPVIGIVQVGTQAMADRYTYLPQIGLGICIAWTAAAAFQRWKAPRWLPAGAMALLALWWGGYAYQQAQTWRDTLTLWLHAASTVQPNPEAEYNAGLYLRDEGRLAEAEEYLRRATAGPYEGDARKGVLGLSEVLRLQGRFSEAAATLEEALAGRHAGSAALWGELGAVRLAMGQVEMAMAALTKALELDPDVSGALDNLGAALLQAGRFGEAVRVLQRCVLAAPSDAVVRTNLAVALAQVGRTGEALDQARKAAALDSGYKPAQGLLQVLAEQGDNSVDATPDNQERTHPFDLSQGWKRDTDGPVLSLGPKGAWDAQHIMGPCVIYENGVYRMYYTGASENVSGRMHKLGLAESTDGVHFTRHPASPLLSLAQKETQLLTPAILRNPDGTPHREEGKLRMWLTARSKAPVEGLTHRLVEATSEDGIAWDLNPASQLDHAYAASVIIEEGVYRMWYTDVEHEGWPIRTATSRNGRVWDVDPEPVLIVDQPWEEKKKYGRLIYPFVLKIDGRYGMWYGAFYEDDIHTAIGFATSRDGIHWTKDPQNPVFTPDPARSFESHYTTSQTVLPMEGGFRIWYASRTAPPFQHKYFALCTAFWPVSAGRS